MRLAMLHAERQEVQRCNLKYHMGVTRVQQTAKDGCEGNGWSVRRGLRG